ncbi:hypothetical protein [Micromonospora sp. NBC_01412]|uniref:hypothetical protein n=1 Tax=Micromonospora sp. NBC_01412 TaxID=2903590 RepID=UPI0032548443
MAEAIESVTTLHPLRTGEGCGWVFAWWPVFDSVSGGRPTDPVEFEVGFVDGGAGEVRRRLVDVAAVPVRGCAGFASYRGQRNYPGLHWPACIGAHIGFESWLERDEAVALDFDIAKTLHVLWPRSTRSTTATGAPCTATA